MVPDETSDLPTTLPEASFLNPNRKVPSEARSLRGLFPVPVFAEFPSYSLSKNADGFLQNPFWLSYCNLRKLKYYYEGYNLSEIAQITGESENTVKSRHRRALEKLRDFAAKETVIENRQQGKR